MEIMENIAYLMSKTHMSFNEIMDLPYAVFLSLLKQFRLMGLKQIPEYRQQLERQKTLYGTEPDFKKLRKLDFINKKV